MVVWNRLVVAVLCNFIVAVVVECNHLAVVVVMW